MSTSARPLAGIICTILAMVSLAGTDAVAKYLTATYPIAQVLWIRYVVYALYGTTVALRSGGGAGFSSQALGLQILRAGVLVVANLVIVFSFSQFPLADVHAVLAVAPLAVTAASVWFLGESVDGKRWAAIATGFIGILIILRPGVGTFHPLTLVPLVGAILYATYQVLTKLVTQVDSHATTQFYTGVIGLVGFSSLAPFVWVTPTDIGWFWLITAGVIGTFAHALIIVGLSLAPASLLQPFNYSMLVAAAILGYVIFGDIPDGPTWFGAALVVAAGLFVAYRARPPADRVKADAALDDSGASPDRTDDSSRPNSP